VANSGSDNITAIDIENRKVLAAVPAGSGPFRMALTSDERLLLVLNSRSQDVAIIRVAPPISLFTLLPSGLGPADIALKVVERRARF
jgi:YVTN family beta-propeller protein